MISLVHENNVFGLMSELSLEYNHKLVTNIGAGNGAATNRCTYNPTAFGTHSSMVVLKEKGSNLIACTPQSVQVIGIRPSVEDSTGH